MPPLQAQTLGYDGLKELAKRLGRPVSTLYALAPQNDPFFIGPARQATASWFASLWNDHGIAKGHHLRRIHYRLISQETPVRMLNGLPFENTDECWKALCNASADARHLGLVPANALVDRRNAEPMIYFHGGQDTEASVYVSGEVSFGLALNMPPAPRLSLVTPDIKQRYHLELWAEKTTVNDVLMRLGNLYGVNIVTGAGELSITHSVNVVERACESGRPVRVLYLSDFDPAGLSMPVAVARKIEHRLYVEGLHHLNIQVRPLVLTAQQCVVYALPRTPIKETERRGARFEERNGEGATELDALEALHSGALQRILSREIERYHDAGLAHRIREAAGPLGARIADINRA